MARLSTTERANLPDSAFAYVDSTGQRKLPIHDESHVRNALSRFDQVQYESPAAKEKARNRLLKAAQRHGIMPLGFISSQVRSEATDPVENDLRRGFPEGFVTLLFTDIEGSTALLRDLGEAYESLLGDVREIVRRSVLEARGIEVEVRADETFSVFDNAAAAVVCAVAMQRSIGGANWSDDRRVRVRVGIHSGKVRLTSNGYIGLAIHKADRVCSATHGGQIVVSTETKNAAGDTTPDSITYRSLGRHHLAGLPKTHRLYQIQADGLTADFPGLRTSDDSTSDREETSP
jgi:class 3 adenylate cyclase